jgi:hypothetical protein
MLDDWSGFDIEKTLSFILSCQVIISFLDYYFSNGFLVL